MQQEAIDDLDDKEDRVGGTEYDRVMDGEGTSNSVIESMVSWPDCE